jgi:RNA polymerase sigma factor (TIGR02999 family)
MRPRRAARGSRRSRVHVRALVEQQFNHRRTLYQKTNCRTRCNAPAQFLHCNKRNQRQRIEVRSPTSGAQRQQSAHRIRRSARNLTRQPHALAPHCASDCFRDHEGKQIEWRNRAHFFALAAQIMRHVLVDYARANRTEKRGGNQARVPFEEARLLPAETGLDLVALDEALRTLAKRDERKSRIVELRYFGGLSIEETAELLALSPTTVRREWTMTKAWLRREMKSNSE